MAYRTSAPDLVDRERDRDRTERWDRDRFSYEKDRDRYGEVRERFEEDDDHVYTRREAAPRAPPPRDRSLPRYRMSGPYDEDDVVIREQRRRVYEGDRVPQRRRPSPPTRYHSPSPVRRPAPSRPTMLRRPSSLDTFDRKQQKIYYEHDREEYGPPARRSDFRAPPYVEIPLPRHKALPPPRFHEQEYYDEIRVSDPDRFGDDGFRDLPPERVRERKVVRTRRRSRSRDSRTSRSFQSSSRSSSSSSTDTSRTTTTVTTRTSEYPKKGKTRIPARLVSRRALIDMEYPFVEEGNTIVIQKALGQQNIDDLLKLSDDYKKSERELEQARSMPGDIVEERRTEIVQFPVRDNHVTFEDIPGGAPVYVTAHRPPSPVEVVQSSRTTTAIVRDVSPSRTYTTTAYASGTGTSTSDSYSTSSYDTVREVSGDVPLGPVAIIDHRGHSRHGSHHHSHSRSRSRHARHSSIGRGELVRAERLSTGELVLLEESVERIEEPSRGVRIEKDRRGPPPKLMRAMLATLT